VLNIGWVLAGIVLFMGFFRLWSMVDQVKSVLDRLDKVIRRFRLF